MTEPAPIQARATSSSSYRRLRIEQGVQNAPRSGAMLRIFSQLNLDEKFNMS